MEVAVSHYPMPKIVPHIAEHVRARREKAGLSQDKLSKLAGMTLHTIAKIEYGKTPDPRIWTVKRIATAFNTTIDELIE